MTRLAGTLAVVTGGGSGIGRALANRFAAEGARTVVVADKDQAMASEVAAALPGNGHRAIRLDVTVESEVQAAVEWIESRLGPIDLWCSNAGTAGGQGLGSDADWERCWRLHVVAHVFAARTVLLPMLERGRGHLMITASAAGLLTETASAPYPVTKHATVALAEWLAIEHGDSGVGFSCLCPQAVRTPLLHAAGDGSAALATGEVLEPDDVADAVVSALAAGHFLILPHPQVTTYEQRRTADRDRWLAGMRRLRTRLSRDRA